MKHIKYLVSGAIILAAVGLSLGVSYYLFFWLLARSEEAVYAIVALMVCYGVGWAYFHNPDEPLRKKGILPWYRDD